MNEALAVFDEPASLKNKMGSKLVVLNWGNLIIPPNLKTIPTDGEIFKYLDGFKIKRVVKMHKRSTSFIGVIKRDGWFHIHEQGKPETELASTSPSDALKMAIKSWLELDFSLAALPDKGESFFGFKFPKLIEELRSRCSKIVSASASPSSQSTSLSPFSFESTNNTSAGLPFEVPAIFEEPNDLASIYKFDSSITILNWGNICSLPKFKKNGIFYPVGYKFERIVRIDKFERSVRIENSKRIVRIDMEAVFVGAIGRDEGSDFPTFTVYKKDQPDVVCVSADSPTEAWRLAFEKWTGKGGSPKGNSFFGFRIAAINQAISILPKSDGFLASGIAVVEENTAVASKDKRNKKKKKNESRRRGKAKQAITNEQSVITIEQLAKANEKPVKLPADFAEDATLPSHLKLSSPIRVLNFGIQCSSPKFSSRKGVSDPDEYRIGYKCERIVRHPQTREPAVFVGTISRNAESDSPIFTIYKKDTIDKKDELKIEGSAGSPSGAWQIAYRKWTTAQNSMKGRSFFGLNNSAVRRAISLLSPKSKNSTSSDIENNAGQTHVSESVTKKNDQSLNLLNVPVTFNEPVGKASDHFKFNNPITILNWGSICSLPNFKNENVFFPVGYKFERVVGKGHSDIEAVFVGSISRDEGSDFPTFTAFKKDDPSICGSADSPKEAWRLAYGKWTGNNRSSNGSTFFGFNNPAIRRAISLLPNPGGPPSDVINSRRVSNTNALSVRGEKKKAIDSINNVDTMTKIPTVPIVFAEPDEIPSRQKFNSSITVLNFGSRCSLSNFTKSFGVAGYSSSDTYPIGFKIERSVRHRQSGITAVFVGTIIRDLRFPTFKVYKKDEPNVVWTAGSPTAVWKLVHKQWGGIFDKRGRSFFGFNNPAIRRAISLLPVSDNLPSDVMLENTVTSGNKRKEIVDSVVKKSKKKSAHHRREAKTKILIEQSSEILTGKVRRRQLKETNGVKKPSKSIEDIETKSTNDDEEQEQKSTEITVPAIFNEPADQNESLKFKFPVKVLNWGSFCSKPNFTKTISSDEADVYRIGYECERIVHYERSGLIGVFVGSIDRDQESEFPAFTVYKKDQRDICWTANTPMKAWQMAHRQWTGHDPTLSGRSFFGFVLPAIQRVLSLLPRTLVLPASPSNSSSVDSVSVDHSIIMSEANKKTEIVQPLVTRARGIQRTTNEESNLISDDSSDEDSETIKYFDDGDDGDDGDDEQSLNVNAEGVDSINGEITKVPAVFDEPDNLPVHQKFNSAITVLQFGSLCSLPKFTRKIKNSSDTDIYPVGYQIERTVQHRLSRNEAVFVGTIDFDQGSDSPTFTVYQKDKPNVRCSAGTPMEAWNSVYQKWIGLGSGKGRSFFGFRDPAIRRAISLLPELEIMTKVPNIPAVFDEPVNISAQQKLHSTITVLSFGTVCSLPAFSRKVGVANQKSVTDIFPVGYKVERIVRNMRFSKSAVFVGTVNRDQGSDSPTFEVYKKDEPNIKGSATSAREAWSLAHQKWTGSKSSKGRSFFGFNNPVIRRAISLLPNPIDYISVTETMTEMFNVPLVTNVSNNSGSLLDDFSIVTQSKKRKEAGESIVEQAKKKAKNVDPSTIPSVPARFEEANDLSHVREQISCYVSQSPAVKVPSSSCNSSLSSKSSSLSKKMSISSLMASPSSSSSSSPSSISSSILSSSPSSISSSSSNSRFRSTEVYFRNPNNNVNFRNNNNVNFRNSSNNNNNNNKNNDCNGNVLEELEDSSSVLSSRFQQAQLMIEKAVMDVRSLSDKY